MYLVADNLSTSEDIREVVAHELIGHFGMRGFFGSELDIVLDEIHKNNPRVKELDILYYFVSLIRTFNKSEVCFYRYTVQLNKMHINSI